MPREGARPLLVDVKRNSLDDGPGIRSVVFFKGCPLRCVWCQNPESLEPEAELQREAGSCIGCRACEAACPEQCARPAAEREDRSRCRVCAGCVEVCPAAARRVVGREWDVGALADALLRDEVFYRRSGGGVTLSGGEPALFPERVGALAALLHQQGVHVLLETCGHFQWEPFAERLLANVSTIYFDLKIADPEQHQRNVGPDNARIHDNLRRLIASGFDDLLPRVPLVPSLTDSEENLRGIARLLEGLGLTQVALLPYNPLWVSKRRALGLDLPYTREAWMSEDEIERCERAFEGTGIRVLG